jgi:hypothetical protein
LGAELDIATVYTTRRGGAPARGNGYNLLFVVLIGMTVAAAGFAGVAFFGPERPIAARDMNAAQPTMTFALPAVASVAAVPSAVARAESAASSTTPAEQPPAARPAKKAKPASKRHVKAP